LEVTHSVSEPQHFSYQRKTLSVTTS